MRRKATRDLPMLNVGVGFLVGAILPFVLLTLGISRDVVLTPVFFAATMVAGAVVGIGAALIGWLVVAPRLNAITKATLRVEASLRAMSQSDDVSLRAPRPDLVTVESDDEMGESANAFNRLAMTLYDALNTQRSARAFLEVMTNNLELEPLARKSLDLFIEQSGAAGGAIFRDESGTLVVAACRGFKDAGELALSDHVSRVFDTGETELILLPANVRLDGVVAEFPPNEVLVLPVRYEGAPLGVVILATATHFEQEQQTHSQLSSQVFGLALNNALAHERLQELAALDPLTGVYNRRFGLGRLHEEFERAVRAGAHLGVLMMDLDLFKAVNDTYGHLAGDRVLTAAADAVQKVLRDGDILLRYGGEEFLAILPAASSEDLALIGERMRSAVGDISVPEGQQTIRITLSLGGAELSDLPVGKEDDLVRSADGALYQAKQTGRNRVRIAQAKVCQAS